METRKILEVKVRAFNNPFTFYNYTSPISLILSVIASKEQIVTYHIYEVTKFDDAYGSYDTNTTVRIYSKAEVDEMIKTEK